MAIIKLTCKQCNGQMELDDSKEIAFCMYCGTKHIIQEEIVNNSYNTTQYITKNIYGNVGADIKDVDELLTDADSLIGLGQREKANEKYKKAIDLDPKSMRAWLGYAKTTNNGDNFQAFASAYKLAERIEEQNDVFSQWAAIIDLNYGEAYTVVKGDHKDVVFEKWLSSDCDSAEIYKIVERGHKDLYLEYLIKRTEEEYDGYMSLCKLLDKVYGSEWVNTNMIPRWVQQTKRLLANNEEIYYNDVELVYEYLNPNEREKIVYNLIDNYWYAMKNYGNIEDYKNLIEHLCKIDDNALKSLKKHNSFTKEYIKQLEQDIKTYRRTGR